MLNTETLNQLKQARDLLISLQRGSILSEMTEEQKDKVQEALDMSDPKKIKKAAEKLITLNNR